MTFDAAISTTIGGAYADLRDKVGGMTNWSIAYDSSGGAAEIGQNDVFTLQAPTGEYFRFTFGSSEGLPAVAVEVGPDYDAANDSWNDRYSHDHEAVVGNNGPAPVDRDTGRMSDSVTYHAAYADSVGFAWYLDRQEGDGNDNDMAIGAAQINKLWDFSTAAERISNYAMLSLGRGEDNSTYREWGIIPGSSGRTSNDTVRGFGRVNTDANFDNYPVVEETQLAADQYGGSVVGEMDLWIDDRSGGSSSHKDTVQDSNGNNIYTLCKAHNFPVGLRMV